MHNYCQATNQNMSWLLKLNVGTNTSTNSTGKETIYISGFEQYQGPIAHLQTKPKTPTQNQT